MTNTAQHPFRTAVDHHADREAVMEVLQGHILTHGPQGQAFEKEFAAFAGDPGPLCDGEFRDGRAAFSLSPFRHRRGDEVIVPAQTHVATVHAVEWVGARPVFADCDGATGNLTAQGIAAAISPRTKAISVVHFNGIPCSMAEIMAVAEPQGLKVIEDCALAVGARYQGKHVGLWGDAGCFSFYPVKHITTGEGGMFITRHQEVAESVAKLRAFGVDRSYGERTIPGIYDVPILGLNYRMSEMQAALGRVQLGRVKEILARRRVNFDTLKKGLFGISGLTILDSQLPEAQNSHYCLSLVLDRAGREQRDAVVARLNAAGVGTSIYYPHPVPRLAYYRGKYGYDAGRFPQAVRISDQSIALPVGPHLTEADIEYIIENFQAALGGTTV